MIGQFLGERQCFTDQTRQALPQHVIKALNVIGFPRFLRDGFMPLCRDDPLVGVVLIRMEGRPFAVYYGDVGLQRFSAVATAIPDVKRNDLACLGIHGDPHPLLVRFLLWKEGIRDVVMEICCALHNFRVRLTPWQPMI